MVRPLDIATQGAIRDRNAVLPRNFVLVTVRRLDNDSPVTFGFTDLGEDVSANVIDGQTGATVTHTFYGDEAPIAGMDAIPYRVGVTIDTIEIRLNSLHPVVEEMVRGHNCRNAPVQCHRGWLSPQSRLLVAPPRCRHLGEVNGTPIVTGAVGERGQVTLKVVSRSRELTRVNPARAGFEFYAARSNDQWGRYSGTAGQWPFFWGEVEG